MSHCCTEPSRRCPGHPSAYLLGKICLPVACNYFWCTAKECPKLSHEITRTTGGRKRTSTMGGALQIKGHWRVKRRPHAQRSTCELWFMVLRSYCACKQCRDQLHLSACAIASGGLSAAILHVRANLVLRILFPSLLRLSYWSVVGRFDSIRFDSIRCSLPQ